MIYRYLRNRPNNRHLLARVIIPAALALYSRHIQHPYFAGELDTVSRGGVTQQTPQNTQFETAGDGGGGAVYI
jgi:hypothetical protein